MILVNTFNAGVTGLALYIACGYVKHSVKRRSQVERISETD